MALAEAGAEELALALAEAGAEELALALDECAWERAEQARSSLLFSYEAITAAPRLEAPP